MEVNKIYQGNCMELLKVIPDNFIDCCVTSPPYFGLRDYGNAEQIGLETTPELFVRQLVNVFTEVKRVLKPEGTLWLNLGDSYSGSGKGIGDTTGDKWKQSTNKGTRKGKFIKADTGLKAKDLIGIPWMVAFALRSAGWYLRQDIIWAKAYTTLDENFGTTMPESVLDRCVKSHEYFFLLSKSKKYYFNIDAIKKPIKDSSSKRLSQNIENQTGSKRVPGKTNGTMKAVIGVPAMARNGTNVVGHSGDIQEGDMANKRSVWQHNPSNFSEAHFATFPEDLIVDAIKAGCRGGGYCIGSIHGRGDHRIGFQETGSEFYWN